MTLAAPLQAAIPLTSAPAAPAAAEGASSAPAAPTSIPASYTCPMHPEVHAAQPGQCPRCGMGLVPEKRALPKRSAPMKDMPMDGMKGMKHGGRS